MSKKLKQLNHYLEFKTEEGITSVIKFIRSDYKTFPAGLNQRQGNTYYTRYSNPDFIVKPKNRKLVLYYRPNPDIFIEVIRPEEKQKKIKEIYDDLKLGLGTGELAFYHQVAKHYLPITKAETTAFLKKQGDFLVNRQPHNVINHPVLAKVPNERWGMDITYFQRYPKNINGGYIYLFVCIDYFSGKVWARGLKTRTNDTNDHEIVDAFDSICQEAGTYPHIVQSDHEFTKGALEVYCKEHNIRQYKTTSYSPVSNGKVERMNRTIRGKVKAIITRNNNLLWYKYLNDIIDNINNQQSARTGFTANQLWRPGYTAATAMQAAPVSVDDHTSRDQLVRHNVNLNEVRAIRQANKTPERHFEVGDFVRIRMTKLSQNNIYRKAKESGIGWSYVAIHYTPEVFRIAIAHHYNKLNSPKRDTYYLRTLDGKSVMSSKSAAVPMVFYGNDLIRVPIDRKATHIKPSTGDSSIRQANFLNRLIRKKPSKPRAVHADVPASPIVPPVTPVTPAQHDDDEPEDYGDYGHHDEEPELPAEPAPQLRRSPRTKKGPVAQPAQPLPSAQAPALRRSTRPKKAQEHFPEPASAAAPTFPDDTPIRFQQANPKLKGSKSFDRYELYKRTKTVGSAIAAGAKKADIRFDYERGFLVRR